LIGSDKNHSPNQYFEELLYSQEMGLKLFSGEKASLEGNLQRQTAGQSERWEGSPNG